GRSGRRARDHGRDRPPAPRRRPDRPARHAPDPARACGRAVGHLGRRRDGREGSDRDDADGRAHRGGVRGGDGRRMGTLAEILSPGFLLRDALIVSLLVGVVCPLVGVYFVLRRMIFLGVALPQLSAAGIAFAFLGYRLLVGPHEAETVSERALALVG